MQRNCIKKQEEDDFGSMTQFISLFFNQIGSPYNMLYSILFCSYKKSLELIGYLEEDIMTTSVTLH